MSQGVTNGATVIPASGSQPVQLATPATSTAVLVYTMSTNTGPVYLGGSTVTSSTGVPIAAGVYLNVDVADIGAIYFAGTENDVVRWAITGRTLPP